MIRRYRRSDDAAVARFFERCHAADDTVTAVDADWWRGFVELAFNRGGQDFEVAEAGAGIVALLMTHRLEAAGTPVRHFRIIVHPERRRQGLATRLLQRMLENDRDRPLLLQSSCPSTWTAARAFLLHHRFEAKHEELDLRIALGPRLRLATCDRYRVSESCEARHDPALAALHNDAYGGAPDFTPPLDAAGIAASRRLPGCRYLLAEAGDAIAGFVQVVEEGAGTGCIESLVVAAEHRRNGLGRLLLGHGLAALQARGCHEIILHVDAGNRGAVALYESAGFERTSSSTTWRLLISD